MPIHDVAFGTKRYITVNWQPAVDDLPSGESLQSVATVIIDDDGLLAVTDGSPTSNVGNITVPIRGIRLNITAVSASSNATFRVLQSGF